MSTDEGLLKKRIREITAVALAFNGDEFDSLQPDEVFKILDEVKQEFFEIPELMDVWIY